MNVDLTTILAVVELATGTGIESLIKAVYADKALPIGLLKRHASTTETFYS
jgi:hypothetical protein